ncbi:MAG TPA: iron uptake porin [Candidatus Obscuribacterales bacterium]
MLKLFGKRLRFALGFGGATLLLSNSPLVAATPSVSSVKATEVTTSQSIIQTEENTISPKEIFSTNLQSDEGSDFTSVAVTPATETPLQETAGIEATSEDQATKVTQSFQQPSLDDPEVEPMGQVTSVSELKDVQPTDWAFQAMRSLIERYGCISGYADGTYRGDRSLTRYEFAAGLNVCIERLNQLMQAGTGESITPEDLAKLERLRTEFAAEVARLPKRLDNLEASITSLENRTFSTTTILNGEILFAASGVGGTDVNGKRIDTNVVFSHRTELNFSTSFTGKDLLRVRLAAGNTPDFAAITGTNFSRLSFTGDNGNNIQIGALFYRFPVGDRAMVLFGQRGIGFGDFTPTLNPYINNSLLANVGNFIGESSVYALNGGRGVGVEYRFSRAARLSLGYLAANPNQTSSGLFNGPYGAIAQLTLLPTPDLTVGLTYVHSYRIIGTGKGSRNAEDPFEGATTSTNSYGLEASYQVSRNFNISGWAGLINAHAESNPHKGSDAQIFTWAFTFALPDFGGLGNLAAFIIGQPPKAINNDVVGREDPDTSLHLEAFYRYQLTNNISITPGFFLITNPEHNADNSPIYVGILRTSFVF